MNIPRKPRGDTGVHLVVAAPLARISDSGPWPAILAAVGAAVGSVFSGAFVGILALLFLAHVFDWVLGSVAAWKADRFCGEIAQRGAVSKLAGLVAVCLLRGFEVWASSAGLEGVIGLENPAPLSIGAAVWLFTVDLSSIAKHNRDLGWLLPRVRRLYRPPDPPADPGEPNP